MIVSPTNICVPVSHNFMIKQLAIILPCARFGPVPGPSLALPTLFTSSYVVLKRVLVIIIAYLYSFKAFEVFFARLCFVNI